MCPPLHSRIMFFECDVRAPWVSLSTEKGAISKHAQTHVFLNITLAHTVFARCLKTLAHTFFYTFLFFFVRAYFAHSTVCILLTLAPELLLVTIYIYIYIWQCLFCACNGWYVEEGHHGTFYKYIIFAEGWSFFADIWLFFADRWSLFVDRWSFFADIWQFFADRWLFFADRWLFFADRW